MQIGGPWDGNTTQLVWSYDSASTFTPATALALGLPPVSDQPLDPGQHLCEYNFEINPTDPWSYDTESGVVLPM